MIHSHAIVVTVTKPVITGQTLLADLTKSFQEASSTWSGDMAPGYFLVRREGQSSTLAWDLGEVPCDLEAMTAWADVTTGIGRAEIRGYFDPLHPSDKAQRTRVERKHVMSDDPIDRSLKPSDVVPALRPLLDADGRRECDDIWCFLSDFVQKTPSDRMSMEKFISAMPEAMPRIHAADQFMKGILLESMRAIVERRPGVTMVCCCWALDLRDGRPDFNTLHKKAKELIDFRRPSKGKPAINPDDDVDAEWASAKFF